MEPCPRKTPPHPPSLLSQVGESHVSSDQRGWRRGVRKVEQGFLWAVLGQKMGGGQTGHECVRSLPGHGRMGLTEWEVAVVREGWGAGMFMGRGLSRKKAKGRLPSSLLRPDVTSAAPAENGKLGCLLRGQDTWSLTSHPTALGSGGSGEGRGWGRPGAPVSQQHRGREQRASSIDGQETGQVVLAATQRWT